MLFMNKKLMSLVISGLLAVSMVGCSDNINKNKAESSIKEEKTYD